MRDSTIISPAPARKNTFIDRGPGLRIFQNKIKMACMATSKTVVYGIILLLIFLREIQPEYRYIPYWLPVSVPVPELIQEQRAAPVQQPSLPLFQK